MLAVLLWVKYNPTMFENENSFVELPNESSKNLSDLDAAFTDPFVERALETARTYNKIFKESTPTLEEVRAIIDELDTAWGNIKDSQVHFTGSVKVGDPEEEGETKQVFLDGARVISNGFCVDRGDSAAGEPYKVKHHLHVQFEDAYGTASNGETPSLVAATGDINSSLIELDTASSERAKAWLTVSCPELIEEIDYRALNGSGDECDALLSLKGLDFNKYTDLSDLFTRNCLNVYLQSIIEVDTFAPYSANLNGYARMAKDLDTLYNLRIDSALLYVSYIGMQPSYTLDENDNGWALSAFTTILGVARTDESQHYVVPVDTIQNLQSIRTAYYTANS